MGRELFSGGEPEQDDLRLIIVIQRVAENSLRGNLNVAQDILRETVIATGHISFISRNDRRRQ
jgi:hypothetical protein